MNYDEWNPIYQTILKRFGFLESDDEKTAFWLSNAFEKVKIKSKTENSDPILILKSKIEGKKVIVCGNAPSLEKELLNYLENNKCENNNFKNENVFIAADGAAVILQNCGIVPDIIVTDLDGKFSEDAEKEIALTSAGSLLLIHAHGDNLNILEKYLPLLTKAVSEKSVIPTCQCRSPRHLFNFGGFTDGDRCVYLADEFDAKKITLLGFDFKDLNVTELKKKKLECAEKLIRRIQQKQENKSSEK
jgi:Uncharacterized Rossmann fold enzyme